MAIDLVKYAIKLKVSRFVENDDLQYVLKKLMSSTHALFTL